MSDKRIYQGTAKLAAGSLLSRALGVVREMLAAYFVGGGHYMDVFTTAFRIPNLVRGILGEKATESAFLPVFKTLTAQGKAQDADQVGRDVFKVLLLLLLVITALGMVLSPLLVLGMGKGFQGVWLDNGMEKFQAAVRMTRLLQPLVVLVGFFSYLGARLLARERFGTYTSAPVIANVVAIVTIVTTYRRTGYYCLAWGVLTGALAECVFFWLFTPDRFFMFKGRLLSVQWRDPNLRKAGQLWIPITWGSVLEKIGTVVESLMASLLYEGAITALNYGRIFGQLPFHVLGLSFNRSVIPYLTEQNAKQNHQEFGRILRVGIRMNLLLLLPTAVFVFLMAEPIIAILLQRGAFDAAATARTAAALRYYALGLIAMGWVGLFSRAFYALLNARTPIRVQAVSLCLNILLNFVLWKTSLQHAGLALAASIAFWFNALVQFVLLNQRLKRNNAAIRWAEVGDALWRTVLPTAVMVAAVLFLRPLVYEWVPLSGLISKLTRLVLIASFGGCSFVVAGWICGIDEIRHLSKSLLDTKATPPQSH